MSSDPPPLMNREPLTKNKPKGRPEKSARNHKNIQRAKGMIQRNPSSKVNSTRKLAKKLGISPKSAHRILREDLRKKPYKYLKRQKLEAPAKQKRPKERARGLSAKFFLEEDFLNKI